MIEVHPQLFDAARGGDLAAVQQIVGSWDENDRQYGYAVRSPSWAVIIALREKHFPIVEWLLQSGWGVPYYVKVYMAMDTETHGPFVLDDATCNLLRDRNLFPPN